nr:MAG TPA: hypothetical protein [Caudoviricetes sp.]
MLTYSHKQPKYGGYIPTDEQVQKCGFYIHSLISCHEDIQRPGRRNVPPGQRGFLPQPAGAALDTASGSPGYPLCWPWLGL